MYADVFNLTAAQIFSEELPREGQAKKFWAPVPKEKRKEGVQYPESPVRELAKKWGVRLSEDCELYEL